MRNAKRPVYLVIRYVDPDDIEGAGEDRPFVLLSIKQTAFAAEQEAAKHEHGTVKKGFITVD